MNDQIGQATDARTPFQTRQELVELLLRDLLGPFGGENEEVEETYVSDRYVLGMLAPLNRIVRRETEDEFAEGGAGTVDEGSAEPSTSQAETTLPSSVGLTFAVDGSINRLAVEASWGRYTRFAPPREVDSASRDEQEEPTSTRSRKKPIWKRSACGGQVTIELKQGLIEALTPDVTIPEITIEGRVRKMNGQWVITIFLVNHQKEPEHNKDEAWLFQPKISVEAGDGSACFLNRRSRIDPRRMDRAAFEELSVMSLLYRREVEFAVGHGIAVHAVTMPGDRNRCVRLETTVVPSFEVEMQTPPSAGEPGFEGLVSLELDMKKLGEAPTAAHLVEKLKPLATSYRKWIENLTVKLSDPLEQLEGHVQAAKQVLEKCSRTLERIEAGIDLLSKDRDAFRAFKFANHAMYLQRVHSIFAAQRRREKDVSLIDVAADAKNHSWFPFQLAFILLNLPSCSVLDHPERSDEAQATADLLWFPTGGGKTEAYLGLAAYVMGLRRLQGTIEGRSGACGIAVLMRYTLRLLTLQQFQRASALICACEKLRSYDPNTWGQERFRIGRKRLCGSNRTASPPSRLL